MIWRMRVAVIMRRLSSFFSGFWQRIRRNPLWTVVSLMLVAAIALLAISFSTSMTSSTASHATAPGSQPAASTTHGTPPTAPEPTHTPKSPVHRSHRLHRAAHSVKAHAKRIMVRSGDTLWALAGKYLHNPRAWPKLYAMNHAVVGSNPNLIFPGEVLLI
jgi:Tfp pilus assembly protein FimV